jgi:hypothetical protein
MFQPDYLRRLLELGGAGADAEGAPAAREIEKFLGCSAGGRDALTWGGSQART